ncbi:recombinase family protein [Streptomyces bobili]|uniref:recombinase family protein n=1 Tax=Streptomyces bobili TaxID=67280 RepID=UPI0036FF4ACF
MDIYYTLGPDEVGDGAENLPTRMQRRQEALSLSQAGAMGRIALQEAISLVRLGVASHLRIPHESHLKDTVTRAVACAESMAVGVPVTIGNELVTTDREPGSLQALAYEAARERHGLLPPATGTEGGRAYISPGWPSDEDCARLAHKLVYEMGYSQADVARIFDVVDGYERPAFWTRQGINRILWEEYEGEKYPRYYYREESGAKSRRAGRLHLPGASFNAMAVLGDERAEAAAKSFDAALTEPHHLMLPVDPRHPDRGLARLLRMVMEHGSFRTLYVTSPDAVFSTPTQRRVVYDLALFRSVQVVENGTRINAVTDNLHYNRLLREGTELFAALWARDNATIVEESRSLAHARKTAAGLRSQGFSLRKIAARLNEEAIPTPSGNGAWSASAVKKLLGSEREADR